MMSLSAGVVPFMIAEGGSLYTCQKHRCFHLRQGIIISKFTLAILAPVTLYAFMFAIFDYVC